MQSPGTHDNRQDPNEASGPYDHAAKLHEFAEFYRQYFSGVAAMLQSQGASYQEAQDAAQETFIDLFQNWDSIGEARGWIFVVARRNLLRWNRRAARTITTEVFPEHLLPPSQDPIERQQETEEIIGLLSSLPRLQRAVMAMHYDGIPTSDIAAELEISESTVRVHLHRARRQLKDLLALRDTDSQQDSNETRKLR